MIDGYKKLVDDITNTYKVLEDFTDIYMSNLPCEYCDSEDECSQSKCMSQIIKCFVEKMNKKEE